MVDAVVIEWPDLGYTLIWGGHMGGVDSSDTWMNWALVSRHDDVVSHDDVEYELLDRSNGVPIGVQMTSDPKLALPEMVGFIKWDGCMQATVPEFLHWDDRKDIRNLCEALERIRDLMQKVPDSEIEDR